MPLGDADKEQSKLVNKLSGTSTAKIPTEKRSFLSTLGLFSSTRKNILNNFKSKKFPKKTLGKTLTTGQTPEPKPEPRPDLSPELRKLQNSCLNCTKIL